MSQVLSQSLGQFMRLEQRLTPQLIQSMDILQLNVMALENRLAEELEKNIALELQETDGEESAGVDGVQRDDRPGEDMESFSRLERLVRERDFDIDAIGRSNRVSRGSIDSDRDPKMEAMANTASRPIGLDEHLLHQWGELELDADTQRAGKAIIYHLDDDGYLRTRLDEVADSTRPPLAMDVLEKALYAVQRLEPVGVAARDIQECLLTQLEFFPGDNAIERQLIEHHLHDVVKNKYPAIAKVTGYSVGEITEAVKVIGSLHLHPARLATDQPAPRITPDVIVDYADQGGGLEVRLTRGNDPKLRISKQYLDMIRAASNNKEVRDFIRQHLEGAKSLIEALKFRRSRLAEVSEAVVERQKEFIERGPQALKVLRMSELAEALECDPSTISRTVAGKYIQTPRGIYPLRYFFTGGADTGDGEATSWDSVRLRVKELIANEDSKHPHNDDQIAALLAKEHIEISRRTVAKYRQQLDIPNARQRTVHE